MNHAKIFGILSCLLVIVAFCIGCLQENAISGEYDAGSGMQHITFGDGTFSHTNYNNTQVIKSGTFNLKNEILTLNYSDGEIVKYYVTAEGHVLIPVDVDSPFPRFGKKEIM